jgi:hypothetical protein
MRDYPTGSEQTNDLAENPSSRPGVGAKVCAPPDPDLDELLAAWQSLSAALRGAILAIVRARR